MRGIHFRKWKYHINLAGSELPLYSVDELAKRLQNEDPETATDSYHWPKFMRRQSHEFYRKW